MALSMILAPLATLLVFGLIAVGIHWISADPAAGARNRLATFAPRTRKQASAAASQSLLRGQRRFSDISGLQLLLQRKQAGDRLADQLARADMKLRPGEYVLLRLAVAAVAGTAVWAPTRMLWLAAAAAAAGYTAPALYVRWRQRRRTRQFEDQLVDALVLISNALKSGFSFMQAMQAVADEMPDPIGAEFRQAIVEVRMGSPVDEAMVAIANRVRSADFGLVVSGMVIQRQVGGNLTEIIGNVVRTVRERHRIHREVRTLTAEQRMEGAVLSVLPLVLLLVLLLASPGYVSNMWAEPSGRLILAAGLLSDLLGVLVIRKLVQIEV